MAHIPLARKRATIADVAQVARVSRATVSRVLNDSPRVSDETRSRVKDAMQRVGFAPNSAGRALALGRADSIAVLITEPISELFVDPTFGVVLEGVVEGLSNSPVLPAIVSAASSEERDRALRHFYKRRFDAVIDITPYMGSELLDELVGGDIPVVLCGQAIDDRYGKHFGCVYADDILGASMAASHLLRQKRTTVGIVMGPESNPASRERLLGYQSVLGNLFRSELVIHTGWDSNSGLLAMRQLLEKEPALDAVLAGSDRIAAGVLTALQMLGRTAPDDISVVGFDDHQIASLTTPQLTTIRQPLREQGRQAAELALSMIGGGEPETRVLGMELIVRDSA